MIKQSIQAVETSRYPRITWQRIFLVYCAFILSCGSSSWPPRQKLVEAPDSTQEPQDVPPMESASDGLGRYALTDHSPWTSGDYLLELATLRHRLGLDRWPEGGRRGSGVRIAVLDNGFDGWQDALSKTLPPNTRFIDGPVNAMEKTRHGTRLAEIAYAMATGNPLYSPSSGGPEILLINSNGFSNFKSAIQSVIQLKVDVVLFAQVWEYGGNFDGQGFINAEVAKATAAGTIWINAAGNFGLSTFSSSIRTGKNPSQIELPYQGNSVRLLVNEDHTAVKIVLAWNDFHDEVSYRTCKDLDLLVSDSAGTEVASSRYIQDCERQDQDRDPRYSSHAREVIRATLNSGVYLLKIENRSQNFSKSDQFRLSADGNQIRMIDFTTENTILVPADRDDVIAVGASDVPYSSRRVEKGRLRAKPDLMFPSHLKFASGMEVEGTSAAAALAAGSFVNALSNGMSPLDAFTFFQRLPSRQ